MAQAWKEIRVFISSTFRDMQAERDHLVRFVFPRLREGLLRRRIHLVDVDLRWGVTADQDAFDLCKDEIERCRPRFICMLGGRYGWLPPPKTLPMDLITQIFGGTSSAGPLTVSQMKSLAFLYVRDGSLCRLRMRPREKAEGDVWEKHAAVAVSLFHAAGLAEAGQSITASEVHFGALATLTDPSFRYFYFRDKRVTESIPEPQAADYREPPGSFAENALEELKAQIRRAEGMVLSSSGQPMRTRLPVYEYPCAWDPASARITELHHFGNHVYDDLLRSVDAELGAPVAETGDMFAEERAALEAFVETRLARYVVGSRRRILTALRDHADGTGGNACLCVTGEPGSGKSALAAKFYREYAAGTDSLVIPHFTGVNATGVRELLLRLCHELAAGAGLSRQVRADLEGLLSEFPEVLEAAASEHGVVLLIDAVNQLEMTDAKRGMLWLPERLPPNVRVILTSLPGPALDALRHRQNPPVELVLEPLDERDTGAVVDAYLQRYRKEFDPGQRAALLSKEDSGNPLYLLTALEELRTMGTYELLPRILELPATIGPLFDWILNRLEQDPGFRDAQERLVGREIVETYCSCVSLGRSGMAQSELVGLVAPGDPEGNVAAVRALLLPYLMRRGELLDFFHSQIREAVNSRYLNSDAKRRAAHAAIARYFAAGADPHGDGTWQGESPRGTDELPFHLTEAGEWDALHRVLTDFRFLERKARTGPLARTDRDGNTRTTYAGPFQLQDDYDRALRKFPAAHGPFRAFERAIRHEVHVLAARPDLVWQQLFNRLQWSGEPVRGIIEPELRRRTGPSHPPWLRTRTPFQESEALLRTLAGHADAVCGCAVSPDGTLVASASWDKSVKLWDARSGLERATLRGHDMYVLACAFSPDGSFLVSGSYDKTLKVWDTTNGSERATLIGHSDEVLSCAISPDGSFIVSASGDGTLKIWDRESGAERATLAGHTGDVHVCAISPDGTFIVSGGQDTVLRIWDTESGTERAALQAGSGWVQGCAISPDNKFIVAAYAHGVLKIWDAASGAERATLQGHPDGVGACAVSRAGDFFVAALGDFSLKIWMVPDWEERATLRGHANNVDGCAISPDGSFIVSASMDKTLKIWSVPAAGERPSAPGHAYPVGGCAFSHDGSFAVSASGDQTLKIWDSETGKERATLRGHTSMVGGCAIDLLDHFIVSASYDTTLKIWDVATGAERATLRGHSGPVRSCAVGPDGSFIVSASDDHTLKVWDVNSGNERMTLRGHSQGVLCCAVSPDGSFIVSGSWDASLRIWDAATGEERHVLQGHRMAVAGCAVSPDSSFVVSAGGDGTLKIWDAATGVERVILLGHSDRIDACAVSPDGAFIVSGGKDKTLRVWDVCSGAELAVLALPSDVECVAIHPLRPRLACGSGPLYLIDLEGIRWSGRPRPR